jgi:hypothetical protein
MRNLFLAVFIDALSLLRLNKLEVNYFPTLSTIRVNDKPCHGVFTPYTD